MGSSTKSSSLSRSLSAAAGVEPRGVAPVEGGGVGLGVGVNRTVEAGEEAVGVSFNALNRILMGLPFLPEVCKKTS